MSSVDITSTNDMTSTAAASEVSASFSADAAHHVTHAITTDAIIRECIKQGFYRNPICNEKLYLHNRGFDSVAPTAFEPYTDVKVLWLEGNGFASLPCGAGYTQVQPPIRVDPFAEAPEREDGAEGGDTEQTEHHVDPLSLGIAPAAEKTLPLPADIPAEERDAFSSLYPTVRQLYLHNNIFRVMPDLSRFQRLDSVNLSGNFFSTIASRCVFWDAKMAAEGEPKAVPAEPSQEQQQESNENVEVQRADALESVALISSAANAKEQRDTQLEQYRRLADEYAVLCEHCPLPEREEGAPVLDAHGRPFVSTPYVPRQPPMPEPEYRNPCSSLRSLNVAGNRLETFEDCLGLLSYKALAVLDLSHNNIVDGEALLFILERLPRLQSLKLSGNPLVRTLPRYRKRLLSRCKALLYLDDRPVFEEERRLVTAWTRAGDDGEEKERQLIQREKAAAEKKRLDDFRRLIARRHNEGGDATAAEAPHGDYVRAITTSAALAAAADTADSTAAPRAVEAVTHGGVIRSHRPSRRSHRSGRADRRPSSDPDNSPTSSESDDSGGEDVYEVETFYSRPGADAAGGDDAARRDAGTMLSAIVPPLENTNKPVSHQASRETSTRVLSSNQRLTPDAANNGDDEDEADIFVPES
ncbi:hypothetical protein ABB37_00918 [Leptomonas pyrrhocoris]|uniref:Uncharacterized protein n=1 Tax=Leptomonas pyrrhocoris TaxID=157538 RepID=A0A0M9GBH3_LEPPY|nr:hypothetical protein ABB37_00918 [Leptomonas pyrrhocoris]XP_015665312.1 hypothetical protein ABB37_00918 [Leptomonas pyrrhocoris]KPA86872.1 hypothetical protein ABB37_00918 [Leptomonas pyrrhocoris]KPA86873.1 hypothetical protein ABB37_00918 [Leptomonas pyrrhocoris]|eukprot:XP_015665311.1 hypothetical protein ABB37_00918 [Leptomonas pyrrhocoris]